MAQIGLKKAKKQMITKNFYFDYWEVVLSKPSAMKHCYRKYDKIIFGGLYNSDLFIQVPPKKIGEA